MFGYQIKERLSGNELQFWQAEDETAVESILQKNLDVAVLNLCDFGVRGLSLLSRIRDVRPEVPVICIVPKGKIDLSMAVMRKGAYEEMQFPIQYTALQKSIRTAYKQKKKKSKKRKKSLLARFENNIAAANLAQSGAREQAKQWLEQDKEQSPDITDDQHKK